MRIAIVTTAWGRPALTDIVLRYYSTFKVDGVEFCNHIAISPEDRYHSHLMRSAELSGFNTVAISNKPLCDKWNAVLAASKACDPDAVLIIGSDDLVNEQFISDALLCLDTRDFAEPTRVCFYHIMKEHLILREMNQCGIRMFSRKAVNIMAWQLWHDQPLAMHMDKQMDRRIEDVLQGGSLERNDDAVVLDIKGAGECRVPFWKYEQNLQGDDLDPLEFFSKNFTVQYRELCSLVGLKSQL